MIDSELAHKIVNKLRGEDIRPSDVIEALVTYEHELDLENKIQQLESANKLLITSERMEREKRIELEADLLEMAKAVIPLGFDLRDVHRMPYCLKCNNIEHDGHKKGCPVLKAESIIKQFETTNN